MGDGDILMPSILFSMEGTLKRKGGSHDPFGFLMSFSVTQQLKVFCAQIFCLWVDVCLPHPFSSSGPGITCKTLSVCTCVYYCGNLKREIREKKGATFVNISAPTSAAYLGAPFPWKVLILTLLINRTSVFDFSIWCI